MARTKIARNSAITGQRGRERSGLWEEGLGDGAGETGEAELVNRRRQDPPLGHEDDKGAKAEVAPAAKPKYSGRWKHPAWLECSTAAGSFARCTPCISQPSRRSATGWSRSWPTLATRHGASSSSRWAGSDSARRTSPRACSMTCAYGLSLVSDGSSYYATGTTPSKVPSSASTSG